MTATVNYIPAPKSVELHLSPSPEFSRYSKKVKALGGRYVDEQEHPYVWSQDGNRVRARRVRYTRAADGRVESQVLRRVFVSP